MGAEMDWTTAKGPTERSEAEVIYLIGHNLGKEEHFQGIATIS